MASHYTCQVKHLAKLLFSHEDVGVEKRVTSNLAGKGLHGPHGGDGIVAGIGTLPETLLLYSEMAEVPLFVSDFSGHPVDPQVIEHPPGGT